MYPAVKVGYKRGENLEIEDLNPIPQDEKLDFLLSCYHSALTKKQEIKISDIIFSLYLKKIILGAAYLFISMASLVASVFIFDKLLSYFDDNANTSLYYPN